MNESIYESSVEIIDALVNIKIAMGLPKQMAYDKALGVFIREKIRSDVSKINEAVEIIEKYKLERKPSDF